MKEKFSVLLSVYEQEKAAYLQQAINSVIHQTLVPDEIVIVKDGPLTSELDEVIHAFCKQYHELFHVIALPQNMGLGVALKIGVEACSYEIIARMDSDDISLPDRFEKQMQVMQQDKEVAVLGGYMAEFEQNPDILVSIRQVPTTYQEIKIKAKMKSPLNHMTVMFRKSAIVTVGNYSNYTRQQDYHLWVKLLVKGFKLMNLPEILVYVRCDKKLFERRGGLSYFFVELGIQKSFLKMGFINQFEFIKNILLRFFIRILPNICREKIYMHILRKNYHTIKEMK